MLSSESEGIPSKVSITKEVITDQTLKEKKELQ